MTVIEFPVPDHFGVCPVCRRNDGCIGIGRDHWFVCHEHRMKWYVRSNVFVGWRFGNELDWRRNTRQLKSYEEVSM